MNSKIYAAIDLKSFYASVECRERGLDPLNTNLVVADATRTDKTICLAVAPSLKALGIPGRPRLFEVIQQVKGINSQRRAKAPGRLLQGSSYLASELQANPRLRLDYIIAPPQMAKYIEYSSQIYRVYLKFIAPEDIHVYSIDEVFIDLSGYLRTYRQSPHQLVMRLVKEVLAATGITATAGIGTNLYLAKIAMDIVAKHAEPDKDGVRIAALDEMSYRRQLWSHRPLTDFWRVGRGYSTRLEKQGLYTMGDIARCSLGGPEDYYQEELLYKMFGVNAELLIDHAWGWEPCTMADIKSYRPKSTSLSTGQVLQQPYSFAKGRLIVQEMMELLSLDLCQKGLVTNQLVLTIGYDRETLQNPAIRSSYRGRIGLDHYGRAVPVHAHGTTNLGEYTASTELLCRAILDLYEELVNPLLLIRRVNISACKIVERGRATEPVALEQDLFAEAGLEAEALEKQQQQALLREEKRQQAIVGLKKRYGKNTILRGFNLLEGATTRDRNRQIGGHKA